MRAPDAAILIVALVIAWSFYKAHIDHAFTFNLFDLVMENGRLSKVSCLVMGAFVVHTWIMVRLTFDMKMTEGYLTIYGATWVAPMLARMFSTGPAPSTTVEAKTTESVTVTTKGKK